MVIRIEESSAPLIVAKTAESSEITLDIFIMYRIKTEFLYSLWQKYPGQNQETNMISTAQVTARNSRNKLSSNKSRLLSTDIQLMTFGQTERE